MKNLISIIILVFSFTALADDISMTQPLDKIVAVVGDGIITSKDLKKEINKVKFNLKDDNVSLPEADVLKKQVLEHLIARQLQVQYAKRMGITVEEAAIDHAIDSVTRTNNTTLDGLKDEIKDQGISFAEYRNSIRSDILIMRLQRHEVEKDISLDDIEVDTFLKSYGEVSDTIPEYHIKDILISLPESPSSKTVTKAKKEAEIVIKKLREGADFAEVSIAHSRSEQGLDGGDLGWRKAAELPSVFADKVPAMKAGDVSDPIRTSNGFHIIQLVEARGVSGQHFITETRVRHILIKPDAITTSEEAKAALEKIRKQILSGEDFAALAEANSHDLVSAGNGGDIGWVSERDLDPAFSNTMSDLEPKKLSQAVQSQFGWHIIEVLERRKIDDTQEFRRNQVRDLIYRRKFEEAVQAWLQRLRSETYIEIYES